MQRRRARALQLLLVLLALAALAVAASGGGGGGGVRGAALSKRAKHKRRQRAKHAAAKATAAAHTAATSQHGGGFDPRDAALVAQLSAAAGTQRRRLAERAAWLKRQANVTTNDERCAVACRTRLTACDFRTFVDVAYCCEHATQPAFAAYHAQLAQTGLADTCRNPDLNAKLLPRAGKHAQCANRCRWHKTKTNGRGRRPAREQRRADAAACTDACLYHKMKRQTSVFYCDGHAPMPTNCSLALYRRPGAGWAIDGIYVRHRRLENVLARPADVAPVYPRGPDDDDDDATTTTTTTSSSTTLAATSANATTTTAAASTSTSTTTSTTMMSMA